MGITPVPTEHAVYLRRAQEAKNRKHRIKVTFSLDDGSRTETWLFHPAEISHVGIWTTGRFLIAYRRIEDLREEEADNVLG